jgi:hypothetical protein
LGKWVGGRDGRAPALRERGPPCTPIGKPQGASVHDGPDHPGDHDPSCLHRLPQPLDRVAVGLREFVQKTGRRDAPVLG